MYCTFFGLQRMPFSMTPDPDLLYMTPQHRESLAALQFAVTCRKGFLVLVGEAGTGKTTLLRRLLRSSSNAEVSSIVNPMLNTSEFFELVLINFGILDVRASKAQRLARFHRFLTETHARGRTAVLIIDEAHKLTPELLEEVRLLTNFETSREKLLQIILAGQPELLAILDRPDMRQLKQRISIQVMISPLTAGESDQYIRSRWTSAGGKSTPAFSKEALELIAQASQGIPRVVNAICDNALLNAFGETSRLVEVRHVQEVLADLRISCPVKPRAHQHATPTNGSTSLPAAPAEAVTDPSPVIAAFERYMPGTEVKYWKFPFGLRKSK